MSQTRPDGWSAHNTCVSDEPWASLGAPWASLAQSPFVPPGRLAWGEPDGERTEADWARLRQYGRTYIAKSFLITRASRDVGYHGRYVHRVFPSAEPTERDMTYDWSEEIVVDGPRRQIRLMISRDAGKVRELRIWRVPTNGDHEELLQLNREDSGRLINMLKALDHIPAEGDKTVRLDDDVVEAFLADPVGMARAYRAEPSKFANLISDDVAASDVIAVANRREQVREFRRLLDEPDYFDLVKQSLGVPGREGVWQHFLEKNPWILGISLAGQLITSWHPDKLEQIVRGASIGGRGKRVDALMRTAGGAINSMVFAEIKHDQTDLVERVQEPYRPECWAPSREVSGGVTQIQQTVYLAREALSERKMREESDGTETGELTFLIRPRCYLIAGHTKQLAPDGNLNVPKVRSFELYRRNLYEPEIITYDELLARAEWHLAEAELKTEQRVAN